jgi:hypothetical protein
VAGNTGKQDSPLGGLGLLAAAVYLCVKGLKKVDARLKKQAERDRKE